MQRALILYLLNASLAWNSSLVHFVSFIYKSGASVLKFVCAVGCGSLFDSLKVFPNACLNSCKAQFILITLCSYVHQFKYIMCSLCFHVIQFKFIMCSLCSHVHYCIYHVFIVPVYISLNISFVQCMPMCIGLNMPCVPVHIVSVHHTIFVIITLICNIKLQARMGLCNVVLIEHNKVIKLMSYGMLIYFISLDGQAISPQASGPSSTYMTAPNVLGIKIDTSISWK